MFHTHSAKENVLHRLKIAKGHLEKILQMVEDDVYCIDVITQTKAVTSAIDKANQVMLEHHLSHCVVDHIKDGREKQAIEEVMKVFQNK